MKMILGSSFENIVTTVSTELERLEQILLDEGYQGNKSSGYLTIFDCVHAVPMAVVQIGICPKDKARKYFEFSQEKAQRLSTFPGHDRSWESRNAEKDQYGGAVRVGSVILSFSGLPELADEALSLSSARSLLWITNGKVAQFMHSYENPYLRKLFSR